MQTALHHERAADERARQSEVARRGGQVLDGLRGPDRQRDLGRVVAEGASVVGRQAQAGAVAQNPSEGSGER